MKKHLTLSIIVLSFFLILASCGGGKVVNQHTQAIGQSREVQITITNTGLTSSLTTFLASTAYSFTVTNHSKNASNFIIRTHPEVPNASTKPSKQILYLLPATQLPAGATQHFTFEFPITAIQSSLEFSTTLPGPSDTGKHLPVSIYPGKKQTLPGH